MDDEGPPLREAPDFLGRRAEAAGADDDWGIGIPMHDIGGAPPEARSLGVTHEPDDRARAPLVRAPRCPLPSVRSEPVRSRLPGAGRRASPSPIGPVTARSPYGRTDPGGVAAMGTGPAGRHDTRSFIPPQPEPRPCPPSPHRSPSSSPGQRLHRLPRDRAPSRGGPPRHGQGARSRAGGQDRASARDGRCAGAAGAGGRRPDRPRPVLGPYGRGRGDAHGQSPCGGRRRPAARPRGPGRAGHALGAGCGREVAPRAPRGADLVHGRDHRRAGRARADGGRLERGVLARPQPQLLLQDAGRAAACEFVEGTPDFDLAVINPFLVVGPSHTKRSTPRTRSSSIYRTAPTRR